MFYSIIIALVLGFAAGAISIYIVLSAIIKKYKQQSLTDELTGLYNSREFKKRLIQETERSKRYKLPFTLLLIDIDRFKEINDTYGYKIADKVLKKVVSRIQNQLRISDLFFRYKLGDEFVVMALNTNIEGAKMLADRIIKNLNNKPFLLEKQHTKQITVSIGFSTFEIDNSNKPMEKEADESLRQRKKVKKRT